MFTVFGCEHLIMDPTSAEAACFEVGIKLGSLYHQFAGTPLSPDSAPALESAMESAIKNQPYCIDVDVSIDRQKVQSAIESQSAAYVEFTGKFATVRVSVEYEDVRVVATMELRDDYPLMEIDSVQNIG